MRPQYIEIDLDELRARDPDMAKLFVQFFREYNNLRYEYDNLNKKYIKLQTQYNILQSENKRLRSEIETLRVHMSRLTDRYNKLIQEKNNIRLEFEDMKMKKGMAELAKMNIIEQLEEMYERLSKMYLADPVRIAKSEMIDSVNSVLGMMRALIKELRVGMYGQVAGETEQK